MAYGYGNKPKWNYPRKEAATPSEREAQAVRQEAQTAAALSTKAPGPGAVQQARASQSQYVKPPASNAASGAEFDEKKQEVVFPAQLNVKYQGQWAGKGYRRESKFGPMLVISLEQAVPAGSKLLITPRKQFPDSLGFTTRG